MGGNVGLGGGHVHDALDPEGGHREPVTGEMGDVLRRLVVGMRRFPDLPEFV